MQPMQKKHPCYSAWPQPYFLPPPVFEDTVLYPCGIAPPLPEIVSLPEHKPSCFCMQNPYSESGMKHQIRSDKYCRFQYLDLLPSDVNP